MLPQTAIITTIDGIGKTAVPSGQKEKEKTNKNAPSGVLSPRGQLASLPMRKKP
jgi:hypothetical protein